MFTKNYNFFLNEKKPKKPKMILQSVQSNSVLAKLAELANESLASDLEGQDFSLANFGNLLHSEMEPIRTRLDSTGRTVSGIAETLYHIQVTTTGWSFAQIFLLFTVRHLQKEN